MKTAKRWFSMLTILLTLTCLFPTAVEAYSTGNDYPYRDSTPDVVDQWNFYTRECTSFAAWCLNSRNDVPFHNYYGGMRWGHAKNWDDTARTLGYTVNRSPSIGSIAYWDAGTYGHVAWVREVNGENITIEEYNWSTEFGFGTRTISQWAPSGFIHIKDLAPAEVKFTFESYDKYYQLGENYARFGFKIFGSVGSATNVGCELYDANKTLLGSCEDNAWLEGDHLMHYYLFQDGSNDISITLSPGTRYCFRVYVVANGQRYYNDYVFFETLSPSLPEMYAINYDANGGTNAPDPHIKEGGKPTTLSNDKPKKSYKITYNAEGGNITTRSKTVDCSFVNWNTAKDGSGDGYAAGSSYNKDADLYLYAQWKNPTAGDLITPSRSGYSFIGWFTNADGGNQITSSTTITKSITIYAHWKKQSSASDPKPDPAACRVFGFCHYAGKDYWFEDGKRQGVIGDPKNIWDTIYTLERGREIYDPESNAWYWLDCVYDGAKANDKEVWMPYIYQDDLKTGKNPQGKWVRYNHSGAMIKGWYTVSSDLDKHLYPNQVGNTYYYDLTTGEMLKGWKYIDGRAYHFNESTGALIE